MSREQAETLRKAPVPALDPDTAEGRQKGWPAAACRGRHSVDRRRPCQECRRLSAQLRLVPQLRRSRRRADPRQVRPILNHATPEQIYAAMLTGPSAMPTFSDRSLTPGEKKDIIAYLLSVRGQRNSPGGYNLGDIGPSAEGIAAFVLGMVALVVITVWLGTKSGASKTRLGANASRRTPAARSWHGWLMSPATPRSSPRPPSGRCQQPRRRSGPNARWRCGSSSLRCLPSPSW